VDFRCKERRCHLVLSTTKSGFRKHEPDPGLNDRRHRGTCSQKRPDGCLRPPQVEDWLKSCRLDKLSLTTVFRILPTVDETEVVFNFLYRSGGRHRSSVKNTDVSSDVSTLLSIVLTETDC